MVLCLSGEDFLFFFIFLHAAETKHNSTASMTHLLNRVHFVVLWQKNLDTLLKSPPPVLQWMAYDTKEAY